MEHCRVVTLCCVRLYVPPKAGTTGSAVDVNYLPGRIREAFAEHVSEAASQHPITVYLLTSGTPPVHYISCVLAATLSSHNAFPMLTSAVLHWAAGVMAFHVWLCVSVVNPQHILKAATYRCATVRAGWWRRRRRRPRCRG